MASNDLIARLVSGFVSEATEIGEIVTRQLLAIESAATDDPSLEHRFDEVARGLHTLKGSAGSLGLEDLAGLAHKMEDLVAPHRRRRSKLPPASVDALLKGLDTFLARLRAQAASSDAPPDLEAALAVLAAQMASPISGDAAAPSSPPSVISQLSRRSGEVRMGEAEETERSWRVAPGDVLHFMREIDRLREVGLRLAKPESDEVLAIVDSLEERVKAVGAEPLGSIIEPLHRLVRDCCRASTKEAKLSVVGSDLSIDRHVLRGLRESLVHIVRNAVDHGIERPTTRERSGKHRVGSLVLRVEQHGNVLYVEFTDDGAGLDMEALRAAALALGLTTPDELDSLTPRELQGLIFGAGFSTARTVTETSGRGVGLDVVRQWVASLRGNVEVHSVPGEGTRFTVTIPVEFGSSPTAVVRIGTQQFGLPMAVIERIIPATQPSIVVGEKDTKLAHEDRLMPLHDLGAVLGLRQGSTPAHGQPLLIVQSQGQRTAIAVDEILGDYDLVVRALPYEVAQVPAFQGASTTARGELLLVLRPSWLVRVDSASTRKSTGKRALVIDDSLTARALHRAMLEAGGFTVHAVASATQALEWLANARYDVTVCDLAMTPMDGLAFTRALRSDPQMRNTPLVLVTAHDDERLRAEGIDAGADAFLTKAECAKGRLLAEALRVIATRKGAVS